MAGYLPGTSTGSDYLLVIAIDFGTTFSGYAFSMKNTPDDIKLNKSWGAEVGFESYKTPTCLLVDGKGNFNSFGYEAERRYAEMLEEGSSMEKKHHLFRRFKMKLHKNDKLSRHTQLESEDGFKMDAMTVFQLSLQFLKNHAIEAIMKAIDGPRPNPEFIRWILTVPAIWTDSAKQFMREAAKKADLITAVNSSNLLIALEPEAAALYCRSLRTDGFLGDTIDMRKSMKLGSKYMVIDCGGGTIDITVHQLKPDGTVHELHYATGGDWGGSRVDQSFEDKLLMIFGKDFVDIMKKEIPGQWLHLMLDFEKKKRSTKPDSDNTININMPFGVGMKYQNFAGHAVPKAFEKEEVKNAGIVFAQTGAIIFPQSIVENIFENVIGDILQHVENLMKVDWLKNIDTFYIVGGFGECGILQKAIKDKFKPKGIKVLIPNEASLSVIKGAVMFGHNPQVIATRISPISIGVETDLLFREGLHDASRKYVREGVARCRNGFWVYIKKGQEIPVGHTVTKKHTPLFADQTCMQLPIFKSNKEDVKYTDEASSSLLGRIIIKIPNTEGGLSRRIEVAMTFGATEITVRAKDISSTRGENVEATLDLLGP